MEGDVHLRRRGRRPERSRSCGRPPLLLSGPESVHPARLFGLDSIHADQHDPLHRLDVGPGAAQPVRLVRLSDGSLLHGHAGLFGVREGAE